MSAAARVQSTPNCFSIELVQIRSKTKLFIARVLRLHPSFRGSCGSGSDKAGPAATDWLKQLKLLKGLSISISCLTFYEHVTHVLNILKTRRIIWFQEWFHDTVFP